MNSRLALLPLACAFTATCSDAPPESPLAGLWSRSEAACAIGFGLRFGRDELLYVTPQDAAPLFDRVRYDARPLPDGGVSLTVRFRLDDYGGGALVFERRADGTLRLAQQRFEDRRTGAVSLALAPESGALSAFSELMPCAASELKGRAERV